MAPTNKAADVARRKSSTSKPDQPPIMLVSLKVKPADLRRLLQSSDTEEETPAQETPDVKLSPESSTQAEKPAPLSGENASDSNAPTPQAEDTPVPSAMGPPSEGGKKKGVKRAAPNANGASDGLPKQRGKPGPKKRQKMEDGNADAANNRGGGGHKLGPKANQGAINAGLRALDRSGKPCRKWARGGFRLKSFTGVAWEVSRWTAPPKKGPESGAEDSAVPSADNSSGKENKENASGVNSTGNNSNSGRDAEMQSAPSNHASSPAPLAVAAAS